MTGYLDGPSGLELGGWAWDPARPEVRLRIEVSLDGEVLRRCTASSFRPDLLDAGIGDGRHAWSVELPPRVFDGQPHTLSATVVPGGVPLDPNPRQFQSRYTGSLDRIDNSCIAGTLRDEARPGAPSLLAEVYGDGRFLGRAPAGTGDGAFEIHLPSGFDATSVERFVLKASGSAAIAAQQDRKLPWSRPSLRFLLPSFLSGSRPRPTFDTAVGVLPSQFDSPYEIHIRDYSWICPRVNLVDETGRYCGEPVQIAGCEHCYRVLGPRQDWGSLLQHAGSVEEMRRQYRQVLERAELVRFPSHDAADRIRRYAPGIRHAVVIETPAQMPPTRPAPAARNRPKADLDTGDLAVAYFGDPHLREACQWEAVKRGIPLRFVEPGHTDAAVAFYANTSPDADASAAAMLIAAGHARIVSFDLGASAAHLRPHTLPIHATPARILDALCELAGWTLV